MAQVKRSPLIKYIRKALGIDRALESPYGPQGNLALRGRPSKGGLMARLIKHPKYNIDLAYDNFKSAVSQAENIYQHDRRYLYAMYHDILDDAQLSSQIETRQLKLQEERPVMIKQGMKVGSDRFDEEALKPLLSPWFYDFMALAIESFFWGHSLIEFLKRPDGNISSVNLIPREHVRPEYGDVLLDLYNRNGLPFREGVFSKSLLEIGGPYDLGILKKVTKLVIMKNYSLADWSRFSEKFGMPFLSIKTASTDTKELDVKQSMAENFGRNGWAILDDQDEINFHESFRTTPHLLYKELASLVDSYISKLISGQTMTADSGSSLAQAQVHERVLDSRSKGDMRWFALQVNHCLFPKLESMGINFFKGYDFNFYRLTPEYEQAAREERMGGAAGKYPGQGEKPQQDKEPEKKKTFRLI